MKNNRQRYNRMYAETPEQEEKSSLAYENSYIAPDKIDPPIEDGVNVTNMVEKEEKPVLKKFRAKTNVNFRITPDIKRTDNIIGTLKMMEIVNQIDDTVTDGFVHVEYERKKGYIKREFLEEV